MISFIHWNINPDIFSVHGFALHYYSLMFVLAFSFGYQILLNIFRREHIDEKLLGNLVIYIVIATLAGARLGDCFFYDWSYYRYHLLEVVLPIQIGQNGTISFIGYRGLASHGGAIGILIACVLYCKKYKVNFLWLLDRLSIVVALAGTFIRLGNLFNSEIIGTPTNVPWAFIFEKVDMIPRHPSQLYESFAYLAIFIFLYKLYFSMHNKRNGFLFGVFLVSMFTARFIIEFWKQNQEPFESRMFLDMGQLLSVPFIIAGIILLYLRRRKTVY
ncbi:prolipoprotein diacylglyceryl transferase [Arachidicoccus ginsenosidimutans]|uniref:prolipoprotein diacylglyceryl transferase n=1 Tax=Arachidicoccus sp. BS20 TaxID=1850526 RepID=UPI0007F0A51C|nr:prolipoprotein diacylglyceryl transferase [Arachidicoccus sp. BS20]ANI88376.1 prolipoprotein diacylglyceryl transferase [Arachidicoccus sp. BS20]